MPWTSAPIVSDVAIVERNGTVTPFYRSWTTALTDRIGKGTAVLRSLTLTAQAAAIGTSAITTTPTAGVYRVSAYLRITQAATTSSSATLTLGWVDGGVSCTQVLAAVTGNTTATTQAQAITVRADSLTDLTYALAYASVGGTAMQCALTLVAEQVA